MRAATFFGRQALIALAVIGAFIAAPAALAADVVDIGYIDQQALSGLRSFADANRQLAQYKSSLDGQFAARMRSAHSAADQQKVQSEFQGKLTDRQRQLFGPLFNKTSIAIASVASSKNLSVVVDKRIVVFGGLDVTRNVVDLLNGPGDPVPPVNTPPPSSVGYVDQSQIDGIPKVKSANDDFIKFRDDQQKQAQEKMGKAKSDTDRQQILRDFQKTVGDKQDALMKPLVDQTKNVIADVARKKNLILVIDKGNIIYGGTDVTPDVTAAMK